MAKASALFRGFTAIVQWAGRAQSVQPVTCCCEKQQGEKAAQELSYTVSLLTHKLASLASLASSWLKSCNTSNPGLDSARQAIKKKGHHRFCHWKIKGSRVKTLSIWGHHCSKGAFFWEPNPREADVIYHNFWIIHNNPLFFHIFPGHSATSCADPSIAAVGSRFGKASRW